MHHPTPRASTRATRWSVVYLAAIAGLLALSLIVLPSAHAAGVIYVNGSAAGTNNGSSWANAYTSLQSALMAASSGDQIWVAAGTYKPDTSGNRSASFTLKSGVEVYGGFAGTETLLSQRDWATNVTMLSGDLNGDDSGFTNNTENSYHVVVGADSAALDGFTIRGGNANGFDMANSGGGIYNASRQTLTNITISGNAAGNGGALYNDNASNPTLTNVTISGNTAGSGGGGIYNNTSSPTLTNVTISGNTAGMFGGGGIYNNASSPTLTNVTISGNTAGAFGGGGIYNNASNPTLTNVTISQNQTTSGGGGLYNYTSSPVLTNVTISGNTAGTGGGMLNDTLSSPTLTNVIINGNRSNSYGGGIANWYDSSTTLTNVTISGNWTGANGAGIDTSYDSTLKVRNSIIWGNRQDTNVSSIADHGGTTSVSYSLVEGGYSGTGNLASDPQFVSAVDAASAPTTNGDYRLLATSPAIDSGNNSVSSPSLPPTDLDGNLRRTDVASVADTGNGSAPIVDMGAYEAQSVTVSSITRLVPATSLTNAASVTFRVVFAESVSGVDTSDFAATVVSGSLSSPSVITISGSGTTYSITVNTGSGDGVLRLDIAAAARAVNVSSQAVIIALYTGGETYTIDKTAPITPVVTGISTDSRVAGDGITNDRTLVLGGTAEADSTVTVTRVGTGVIGTTTANGTGSWNFDYTSTGLADGTYSFTATATDIAGNTSASSSPFAVTVQRMVWYVNDNATGTNNGSSWANAYTSLQSALAAAESGDQIWVAAGTYTPTTTTDRTASLTLKSGVAVYGGFVGTEAYLNQRSWTSNLTTLSGEIGAAEDTSDNSYHVVTGATGAILDGVTISGGNANGSDQAAFGGGVYNNASSPTLINVTVSSNVSGSNGGGVYNNASSPTLINVTVSSNVSGSNGGGIYNNASSPTLINGTVNSNAASCGGGIYNNASSPMFSNVTVSSNTAGCGGGIYNNASSPMLSNVTVSSNVSSSNGGGISNAGDSSLILTNVTISGNSANINGGGVYNSLSALTLTNATIGGNLAGNTGGGLFTFDNSTVQIRNSILWGNRVGDSVSSVINGIGNGTTEVTYSIVEGGYSGTGNLASDPQFVSAVDAASAPTTGGDYRLLATSPAIDAGNNSVSSPSLPPTDLDGNMRRKDVASVADSGSGSAPIVDMGAYEHTTGSSVNLQPMLDQPADLVILEDATVRHITLTGISAGSGESQMLSVTAVSSNPALIPNPTVSYASPNATGRLSFTPVADANGTATVTVTVQDSGGTSGGGVNTLTHSFSVRVTAVNDAPSFTAGANPVKADTGKQTVSGWASGFSAGPADEANQTLLGYTIVANSAPELFSAAPAINASGTLTYTPKPGAGGTATIQVVARDSGSTANGGVDISAVRTFTIIVGGSYSIYLPLMVH